MTSSRKLILEYLQHKPLATAIELSRALKMTPANVRHHLRVLIEEGAVEVAEQGLTRGRGRPTLLFALTQQSQSHNLDGLAHALLKTLLAERSTEERSLALQKIASLLVESEGDHQPANPQVSLAHHLYQAVQRLNEMGYQARWEAHSEAPRLLLGHCPYAAILPEHPELCQMDAHLLESLLGAPVTQTKKRAQDSRGARYCLFLAGRLK